MEFEGKVPGKADTGRTLEAFMMRGGLLASLLCCSMLAAASTPDLSGAWARTTFELEPPASGLGPLHDAPRGSVAPPADASPILKPAAAAIVKTRFETVEAGKLADESYTGQFGESLAPVLETELSSILNL